MIISAADVIPLAGFVCFCSAMVILWSNPRRATNQILATLYFFLVTYNAVIVLGINGVIFDDIDEHTSFIRWRRLNAAVMAFFPFGISLLKHSITSANINPYRWAKQHLLWLVIGGIMLILCSSRTFIYFELNSNIGARGIPYILYGILGCTSFLVLSFQLHKASLSLPGVGALELSLAGLNFSIACFATIFLTNVGNIFQVQPLRRSIFLIFPASAIISVWAMTSSRLYDPRHIFLRISQKAVVTLVLALGGMWLWHYYKAVATVPGDLLLWVGLWSGAAFWIDRRSREWLDIDGKNVLACTRQDVIEIALNESDPDKLKYRYEAFLTNRFQASFASILSDTGPSYSSSKLVLRKDLDWLRIVYENSLITPESLERRRTTRVTADLQLFMARNSIGVLSISPVSSRVPSLILVLGRKKAAWSFTYPQLQHLQNIGELIDNVLSRSRLATQAAAQARIEHLAMMSRGLAHDLKNLITPVSSFLIHTDSHFQANSPEADVHSAARRSVRIMTDYIREALFFSERLEPRFEPVDVAKLFSNVAEITTARAAGRQISVAFTTDDQVALCADAVLLQRVLANLVNNAIDASLVGGTVEVLSVPLGRAHVRFEVRDVGRGISRENLSRIFDPYFTTKEFGDEIRGFGLGLTICQKIVQLHAGTISVESELSQGTTVSIDLPAVPQNQGPTKPTA